MAASSNVNDSVASASKCELDPQLFEAAVHGFTHLSPHEPVNGSVASVSNCEFDPQLFKAASLSDIKPFMETNQDLKLIVTPTKNTILHTHIMTVNQTDKSTEFVKQILQKCPSLLLQVNANGDTPLHVAARYGDAAVMEVLIECSRAQHEDLESGLGDAKQMLRITNKERNTALHEAVRSDSLDVVKILTREDPEFSYSANLSGESPLFIAAEMGLAHVVTEILDSCVSPAHEGPGGKTALHAAARTKNLDMVKKILEKKKYLTKEADQNGWIPLHYAAYYSSTKSIFKQLLKTDRSTAYATDKVRKMTALHMAASQGYRKKLEEIMCNCPDCSEMVDDRGWNVLHFAIITLSANDLRRFVKKFFCILRSLLNRKDVKGYTPLHVLRVLRPRLTKIFGIDIPLFNDKELKEEIEKMVEVATEPYRKGTVRRPFRWKKSERITKYEKGRDIQLLVSALIATVTFAAAFTMPGGYKSDGEERGTAILIRRTAFKAFVISDGMAMSFSLYAVFLHFSMAFDSSGHIFYLHKYSVYATVAAIVAMVVAFVTGTYAVLIPTPGLAVAFCLAGLSFFLLLFLHCCKFWHVHFHRKP